MNESSRCRLQVQNQHPIYYDYPKSRSPIGFIFSSLFIIVIIAVLTWSFANYFYSVQKPQTKENVYKARIEVMINNLDNKELKRLDRFIVEFYNFDIRQVEEIAKRKISG